MSLYNARFSKIFEMEIMNTLSPNQKIVSLKIIPHQPMLSEVEKEIVDMTHLEEKGITQA